IAQALQGIPHNRTRDLKLRRQRMLGRQAFIDAICARFDGLLDTVENRIRKTAPNIEPIRHDLHTILFNRMDGAEQKRKRLSSAKPSGLCNSSKFFGSGNRQAGKRLPQKDEKTDAQLLENNLRGCTA